MRAQDRRRQLLEVAADLFARHGYRGTTTARLAEAAGITEPILYRHFPSKHDLFVTLIDEVSDEVVRSWQAKLDGVRDPTARLRALLAANPATHGRGRSMYRVLVQAMTEIESDDEVTRPLRRHLSRVHGFLRDELDRLQSAGAVRRDESASALAWLLIHLAIGSGMVLPLGVRDMVSREGMRGVIEDLVSA
jgi:AcrR family transcriptional regulator